MKSGGEGERMQLNTPQTIYLPMPCPFPPCPGDTLYRKYYLR